MQQFPDYSRMIPTKRQTFLGVVCILIFFMIARQNYLFFHAIAELTRISVSLLVFVLGSKTYEFSQDRYLQYYGIVFLYLAVLDFFHIITYYGMGVFPDLNQNTATQFYIASQYLKSFSLLMAVFIAPRQWSRNGLMMSYGLLTIVLIVLIIPFGIFPVCYIPGYGLSDFKIISEYLISVLFIATIVVMYRRRQGINIYVYRWIMLSIVLNIASEFLFTLYIDVYGIVNFCGHMLLIIADYLIYKGIVSQGLVAPYKTIFYKLKVSNENLLKANQSKSVFLATVGHELRTPLTGILGLSEELLYEKNGPINHRQKDYLEDIFKSGMRLLGLINNLLDLTKIESGKESLTLTEVQADLVLADETRKMISLAGKKKIQLKVTTDSMLIIADEDKIRQVIQNLLGNAIKFSPTGSVISVCLNTVAHPRDGVILEVSDPGIGIPYEEQSRIFEVFYQTDKRLNQRYEGSGIGLALVKKIVELHQGLVWVNSRINEGSTFYIFLPQYPLMDQDLK